MSRPIHETLRILGQGTLTGTLAGALLGAAAACLGPVGLVLAALAAGATLITVANALKRRDQRRVKDRK